MGGWRKLHNEELRDLYCIITIMKNNENNENNEMDRICSPNGGEEERVYVVGGKARGKEVTRNTKT
jgi:hypothetical protein